MYQFILVENTRIFSYLLRLHYNLAHKNSSAITSRYLYLFKDKMNNTKKICKIQAIPAELPTFHNTCEQCRVVFSP